VGEKRKADANWGLEGEVGDIEFGGEEGRLRVGTRGEG